MDEMLWGMTPSSTKVSPQTRSRMSVFLTRRPWLSTNITSIENDLGGNCTSSPARRSRPWAGIRRKSSNSNILTALSDILGQENLSSHKGCLVSSRDGRSKSKRKMGSGSESIQGIKCIHEPHNFRFTAQKKQ